MTQPASSHAAETGRYFSLGTEFGVDPVSGERPLKLKYYADGKCRSRRRRGTCLLQPSTGAVIAHAPQCTAEEVEAAIQAGVDAFPAGRTRRSASAYKSCSG